MWVSATCCVTASSLNTTMYGRLCSPAMASPAGAAIASKSSVIKVSLRVGRRLGRDFPSPLVSIERDARQRLAVQIGQGGTGARQDLGALREGHGRWCLITRATHEPRLRRGGRSHVRVEAE